MGDDRTYTCAACGGTFIAGWSEEEAEAEYRALWPESAVEGSARDVVCDDCFQAMTRSFPPSRFEAEERVRASSIETLLGKPVVMIDALDVVPDRISFGDWSWVEPLSLGANSFSRVRHSLRRALIRRHRGQPPKARRTKRGAKRLL